MSDELARAEAILRETCGSRLHVAYAMAPLTTFRVGGPAALFLEPQTDEDLDAASRAIRSTGVPYVVVGKGSNVLVADAGFPGIVLRLGKGYRWAGREGERLTAGGAMPLPALAGVALHHGLSGLEFGVAIPASLGGAVRMNAGAHEGDMAGVIERVDLYLLEHGRTPSIASADVGFAYRRSALPRDAVVVAATLRLAAGDRPAIRASMEAARAWRRRTQPLAEPNCGSVFKNPPGDHAARLIEAAGVKGAREGGAEVSTKHANFIVTRAGARAADVTRLIKLVQARVREDQGVDLEPEVQVIGIAP